MPTDNASNAKALANSFKRDWSPDVARVTAEFMKGYALLGIAAQLERLADRRRAEPPDLDEEFVTLARRYDGDN